LGINNWRVLSLWREKQQQIRGRRQTTVTYPPGDDDQPAEKHQAEESKTP